MKKSLLYMFLILQLLLVITNVFNLNNDSLIFELTDVLKLSVICFSTIYILFMSKYKLREKTKYLVILLLISCFMLFEKHTYAEMINIYYYISSYSFILFFYRDNQIKRYKFINICTLLLIISNIYCLLFNENSIEIELLINILLPVSLTYYYTNKKILIPTIILTLLNGYHNSMNLILINTFVVSVILLLKSKGTRELIINGLLIIGSGVLIIKKQIFNFVSISDIFYRLSIRCSLSTIALMTPLVILLCLILSNYVINKNKPLGLTMYIYALIVYITLAILDISNVTEGITIVVLAYIMSITINRIESNNKRLKHETTILALHLGYGGIEQYVSSLSKMIDKTNIVSTYKLYDKPPFEYNSNISYLLDYGPNKERLKDALKNKKILSIIKESFVSTYILYKKKYENIEAIEDINTKYIITTRDFHNLYTGFYGRRDIVKIATEHNHPDGDMKYVSKLIKSVEHSDYFVLVSKSLEEYYRDLTKTKTVYIPNVLDKLPKTSSKVTDHSIITIGRLSKVKGYDDLIKLVELLKEDYKDISLTIVGDGEERKHLEKLINKKKLDKNITITGFLNKDDIELELVKKNVFVSTSFKESFGLVALEASSYKLPVVAFSCASGLKELLKGSGILIDNRDLNKMKEEISKLFDDKKYRNKISKACYENSKTYLIDNVKLKWDQIIK